MPKFTEREVVRVKTHGKLVSVYEFHSMKHSGVKIFACVLVDGDSEQLTDDEMNYVIRKAYRSIADFDWSAAALSATIGVPVFACIMETKPGATKEELRLELAALI